MPAKNRIKLYFENGYYHLYNRGVEKRNIFEDEEDYQVFLSFVEEYLTEINRDELLGRLQVSDSRERMNILFRLRRNN